MYKLIVSDMDGTLLNSAGEIPEENLNVIKKAQGLGVEFAIVTGRPYVSVRDILKHNNLKCSVIGCNGAQVVDKTGTVIRTHYIEGDSLYNVLRIAEKEKVYYHIYDDHYIYTKSRLRMLKVLKNYSKNAVKSQFSIRRITRGIRRLFFSEVRTVKNLCEYAAKREKGFYKVQIASLNQDKLNTIRKGLEAIKGIDFTSSAYFNIEIGPSGITKGTALKELAEAKGIKPEEIIALGDNYNDIPMIEYAGCGVAMENAEPDVKGKANFHTKSNDDNGVAYAIEKLVLGEFKES